MNPPGHGKSMFIPKSFGPDGLTLRFGFAAISFSSSSLSLSASESSLAEGSASDEDEDVDDDPDDDEDELDELDDAARSPSGYWCWIIASFVR
jgi:hypothetical protein